MDCKGRRKYAERDGDYAPDGAVSHGRLLEPDCRRSARVFDAFRDEPAQIGRVPVAALRRANVAN
jgi:hypothetical protein